jgi:hypothetical protein
MPKRINITGQRFGRLIALEFVRSTSSATFWRCKCDCGKIVEVARGSLTTGKTRSCGCLLAEIVKTASRTHGMSGTSEHNAWMGMIQRCTNPSNARYSDYGGRGICVCSRWLSFENFISDMGLRPDGCTLDRIDNDKGYSPDNCRWATTYTQASNKRNSKRYTCNGMTLTEAEWAAVRSMKRTTIQYRIKAGWTIEQTLGFVERPEAGRYRCKSKK